LRYFFDDNKADKVELTLLFCHIDLQLYIFTSVIVFLHLIVKNLLCTDSVYQRYALHELNISYRLWSYKLRAISLICILTVCIVTELEHTNQNFESKLLSSSGETTILRICWQFKEPRSYNSYTWNCTILILLDSSSIYE
jgi:hypothetical protein